MECCLSSIRTRHGRLMAKEGDVHAPEIDPHLLQFESFPSSRVLANLTECVYRSLTEISQLLSCKVSCHLAEQACSTIIESSKSKDIGI